jgi:hypothetical protein
MENSAKTESFVYFNYIKAGRVTETAEEVVRAGRCRCGSNIRQQEVRAKRPCLNRQQGREGSTSEKECRREVVLGGYYKNPE